MSTRWRLLLAIFAAGVPAVAHAVDGVAEISHSCALRTGCFSGDTAGYPVTITRAGSYRLTGNLETGSKNLSGIEIESNDVTVDLNGFTITCTLATGTIPLGCLVSSGTGRGVATDFSTRQRVSVANGVVREMGADGVVVGERGSVTNVKSSENGGRGIVTGGSALVSGNVVHANTAEGIFVGAPTNVFDNTANFNGSHGIALAAAGCRVSGNVVYENDGYGIRFFGRGGYGGNVVVENVMGTILGTAFELGGNVCGTTTANADAVCP